MTPEQKAKRLHYHMYESCEGIAEHAERIVKLEELLTNAYLIIERAYWQPTGVLTHGGINSKDVAPIYDEMRKLGIEVHDAITT